MCTSRGYEAIGLAGDPASPVHRLDPRAKVVGLIGVTLVAVCVPLRAWPVWVACALVLGAVALTARVPVSVIWHRTRIVLPLVLAAAMFVPFVRTGGQSWHVLGPLSIHEAGLAVFAAVAAKATIGTVSAVLLGATTTFPNTLRALEALRVPAMLTLIAGMTYRYLFVVAGEVGRMRNALTARAYHPRHLGQAGALGRAATALFLRTHARGERVHLAMLSRGFTGTMPVLAPLVFGRRDAVFLAAVAGPPLVLLLALVFAA